MGERRGTKGLELWCKRMADGYPGVKIENMTTSWRDGLAFCAIIHHFRPELIDFNKLKKEDVYENNELAFRVAEQFLGIPALLEAEDMVEYAVPDRLSILTYLSQFYQAFAVTQASPSRIVPKRPATSSERGIVSPASTSPPTKKMPLSTSGVLQREPCSKCRLPVFIAERLNVGKQLFHRTCFRCARCNSQLILTSYYETETQNEYCCETCPDEEDPLPKATTDFGAVHQDITSSILARSLSDEEKSAGIKQLSENSDNYSALFETALEDTLGSRTNTWTNDQSSEYTKARSSFMHIQMLNVDAEDDGDAKSSDSDSDSELERSGREQVPPQLPTSKVPKELQDIEEASVNKDQLDESPDSGLPLSSDSPVNSSVISNSDQLVTASGGRNHSTKTADADQAPVTLERDTGGGEQLSLVKSRMRLFETTTNSSKEELAVAVVNDLDKDNSNITIPQVPDNTRSDSNTSTQLEYLADNLDSKHNISMEEDTKKLKELPEEKSFSDHSKISIITVETDDKSVITISDDSRNSIITVESSGKEEQQEESRLGDVSTFDSITILPEIAQDVTENSTLRTVIVSEESNFGEVSTFDSITILPEMSQDITENSTLRTVIVNEESTIEARNDVKILNLESSNLEEVSKDLVKSDVGEIVSLESRDEEMKIETASTNKTNIVETKIITEAKTVEVLSNTKNDSTKSNEENLSKITEEKYPVDLNPFGDDEPMNTSTNPFGDEDEDMVEDERDVVPNEFVTPSPKPRSKRIIQATSEDHKIYVNDGNLPDFLTNKFTTRISENPYEKSAKPLPTGRTMLKAPKISLNPFGSDEEISDDCATLPVPSPRVSRASTEEAKPRVSEHSMRSLYGSSTSSLTSITTTSSAQSSARKKKPAPKPPSSADSEQNSLASSPSTSVQHSPRSTPRPRKSKKAPLPPSVSTPSGVSKLPQSNLSPIDFEKVKVTKDEENRNRQSQSISDNLSSSTITNLGNFPSAPDKSTYGKWKRKKGQAPEKPTPMKRTIKALPIVEVKRELDMIEVQQQGLEKQGVKLEHIIRDRCERVDAELNEDNIPIEVEDLILQLFEVVNEKNDLCRRQAELMYLKKQHRLEEEYADVEYQIRCLMLKPEQNKTESDKPHEEELIQRLVEIVERRNEIIDCLEMDRLREHEEDDSCTLSMNNYANRRDENSGEGELLDEENQVPDKNKTLSSKKDKKKSKLTKKRFKIRLGGSSSSSGNAGKQKNSEVDVDKDIDETEVVPPPITTKERKKKKFAIF